MKILIALTYYKPYISGLTIYAQRIADELAKLDHQVTVLTSKINNQKEIEIIDKVKIIRTPALIKFNKGLIMPKMVIEGWRQIKETDILHLHLPQFDAFYLALFAKIKKVPIVTTYQCDLTLPPGIINKIAEWVTNLISKLTLSLSDLIITTSLDYANHSRILQNYMEKVKACYTPITNMELSDLEKISFIKKFNINPYQPTIGMAGRLATEKGMEVLADAFPFIQHEYPNVLFLHAGNSQNVLGEEKYRDYIFSKIRSYGEKWRFLGKLTDSELTAFYQNCDVLVFPSLNSTEAFGMVQIEAMIQGTPVVASDLPGSRQPVKITKMGKIVPIRDSKALALAIIDILNEPERYKKDSKKIAIDFSPKTIAEFYQAQFQDLLDE